MNDARFARKKVELNNFWYSPISNKTSINAGHHFKNKSCRIIPMVEWWFVLSWTIPGVMNNKIPFLCYFDLPFSRYCLQFSAMSLFQELDNNPHLCFDKYILQLVWRSECWLKIWDKVHLLFYDQSTLLWHSNFLTPTPQPNFLQLSMSYPSFELFFLLYDTPPHTHTHFRKKIKLSGKWLFPINTSAYLTSQLCALFVFFFFFSSLSTAGQPNEVRPPLH